jgi:hypothetical protein
MLNLVISVQLYSVVVGYRLKAVIGCRQNEAPRFSQVARWKLHHQALCVPTVSYPLSAPQRSRNAILPIPELSYITGIMRTPLISFLPALREFPSLSTSRFRGCQSVLTPLLSASTDMRSRADPSSLGRNLVHRCRGK